MGGKRTAKSRLRFSKTRLAGLPVPDKGRAYHYDTEVPGLCLCVTSAGTMSYYSYRWVGRPVRVRIGRFPDVSVEAARKQAAEINAAVARGEDPQAERVAIRGEPTIGVAFEHWLNSYAKHHKKDGGRRNERQYGRHLKPWRNRKLSEITRRQVEAWHLRIGEKNGKVQANRVLQFLSSLFNRARGLGFEGANPTHGVKRFREVARDRFLQPDELPRFLAAVAEEPSEVFRDFFMLCLFTGGRRSNVASMQWADISLETATWRIPASSFKTGEPTSVPLSEPALAILRRREATRGDCPWVLPSKRCDAEHITEPKRPWKGICERAKLEDLTIHDLRRTLGSWQAAGGATMAVIGKSLGHRDGSAATKIYARMNLDAVRESVDKATAAMLASGNGENDGKP